MTASPVVEIPFSPTRLGALRRRLGVQQKDLAARIGCSAQDYSRLESACRPDGLLQAATAELFTIAAEQAAA